jgi:hypothetical protein
MIRAAVPADIGAIVRMTVELARETGMPITVDPSWTAAFVARVIGGEGLALVAEIEGRAEGMIVATIGRSSVSPAPIAIEHGWFCGPAAAGFGLRLLGAYEDWARAKGCAMARMSIASGSTLGRVLSRRHGYLFAETALVKVL